MRQFRTAKERAYDEGYARGKHWATNHAYSQELERLAAFWQSLDGRTFGDYFQESDGMKFHACELFVHLVKPNHAGERFHDAEGESFVAAFWRVVAGEDNRQVWLPLFVAAVADGALAAYAEQQAAA